MATNRHSKPDTPTAGTLVILCEQQRENVYSVGPARTGPGAPIPFFLPGDPAPTTHFSIRSARNGIGAWKHKTGIKEVLFVPASLATGDWRLETVVEAPCPTSI